MVSSLLDLTIAFYGLFTTRMHEQTFGNRCLHAKTSCLKIALIFSFLSSFVLSFFLQSGYLDAPLTSDLG